MRILLVHDRYRTRSGEDAVFAAEAALLRRHGHEVSIHAVDNRSITALRAPAAAVWSLWSRPAQRALEKRIGTFGPDVAHFHNTFPLVSPAAYYTCRRFGVPVVQTLHNYRLLCPAATLYRRGRPCEDCAPRGLAWPGVLHRCYRGSSLQSALVAATTAFHRTIGTWNRRVDAFVTLTEFARRRFVESGLPPERVFVKPNFVDPAPSAETQVGGYALFVGRLAPEKGVRTVLRAWRSLPAVPLRIIGDGPMYAEARALAAPYAGDVRVEGALDRAGVLRLMRGARFIVFPSEWYEGFPLVLAEAFACGRPVLAARIGAAAEIVADGRTGRHFAPGDARDLARKAIWLWSRPSVCREWGRVARREFERRYTGPRNHQILENVYRLAAREAGGGRSYRR